MSYEEFMSSTFYILMTGFCLCLLIQKLIKYLKALFYELRDLKSPVQLKSKELTKTAKDPTFTDYKGGREMTLSLTDIEVERVLDACNGYMEIMGQGEDTHEYTIYEIETGLGSALRKLSKGRNGERVYRSFETVRQYPTFDEWKAARAESELVEK